MLYPDIVIDHIPMIYEQFNELKVFNEMFTSKRSKGNHSSIICAFWAVIGGNIASECNQIRVGTIEYFVRHSVRVPTSPVPTQPCYFKQVSHIFARVHW